MNREIKFRAWDKKENKMIAWEPLQFEEESLWTWEKVNSEERYVFMQYTGLKDKNGVEIYEGDIVQFCNTKNTIEGQYASIELLGTKAVVEYKNGSYEVIGNLLSDCCNWNEMEVIGNIYENPELMVK